MSFNNIEFLDFTLEEVRNDFKNVLKEASDKVGSYQANPIIDGENIETPVIKNSINPSNLEILGKIHYAHIPEADQAINSLKKSKWSKLSFKQRADIIRRAADIMAERRMELAALEILEVGKPWVDAEQDIAEAIDAFNFYAYESEWFDGNKLNQTVLGEFNFTRYIPLGNILVISPWNFPIAIAGAMTSAALLMGNKVILKPAEQSSLCSQKLVEILLEAGVYPDAIAHLPGLGEEIGAHLVQHPDTDMICFTGSVPVGLGIINTANQNAIENKKIKKFITEMGGKNCLVVDSGADLDEAIPAILTSAFGFAGQKCSALSRLIIVEEIYDTLVHRIKDAIADLVITNPVHSSALLGPVIDQASYQRLKKFAEVYKSDIIATLELTTDINGYYISPTIFEIKDLNHELWTNELFAPYLCVTKVRNFKEGIDVANNSSYALTGGIFSRSPKNIEYAIENLDCGNLYINRGVTGAIIERQPFGGHKLSGTGPKAGGTNYLFSFVHEKSITENSIRKGFVPDLS